MSQVWKSTILHDEETAINMLTELHGKRWLSRGVSKGYRGLVPSIDRGPLKNFSRNEKLIRERRSIDMYRSSVRFFADEGEQGALHDDVVALMVLRHYGVPTRLLDWSRSPFVSAYFAAFGDEKNDGDIWSFDYDLYESNGKEQWKKWPETTIDGSGEGKMFRTEMTAFTVKEPKDWFVCQFYPTGFHRQKAQAGLFSFAARFGRNHAELIAGLLADNSHYHRYVVPAKLKPKLLKLLREQHGIWRGSLFPDSAGAAETAKTVFRE